MTDNVIPLFGKKKQCEPEHPELAKIAERNRIRNEQIARDRAAANKRTLRDYNIAPKRKD